MDQTIINWLLAGFGWLLAGFGALIGFLLNAVWQAVKELQAADKVLADMVSRIEVLVAGNYVRKEDFDRTIERLFDKLDHIELKIDQKMDKGV